MCSTRFPNLTTAGEHRQVASRLSRGPTDHRHRTCGHWVPSARRGSTQKFNCRKTDLETTKGESETPKLAIGEKIIGKQPTETGDAKGEKSEVPLLNQSGVQWPSTPLLNWTALDSIGLLKVRQNTINTQIITTEMPTLTSENSLRTQTSRTNQLKESHLWKYRTNKRS